MDEYLYSGFYSRFDTISKPEGSLLMGPDNIVGDDFTAYIDNYEGRSRVWLKNKFDKTVGFLDFNASRKIQISFAKGQSVRTILSFVAYSDIPDPGCYWGEVAIFCYNPTYKDEFDYFIDKCSKKISNGIRPNINLGNQSVQNILSNPEWFPKETIPLPKKESGFAILKDRRSISENLIEKGRSRNKGCYFISWIFILAIVFCFVYLLHVIGLF